MKFAVSLPNWGPYADPNQLVQLAVDAEAAGWDGVFLWDHLVWPRFGPDDPVQPVADPWVALSAIAARTERVRLGAVVTPLSRRRPWKVAREIVTLDQLSGGRAVLGAGLGAFVAEEFAAFGEEAEPGVRAEMLDEALEIIDLLQSGERVTFAGQRYRIEGAQFLPKPVQQPRVPVWVAGMWPNKAPFRRAARWDGVAAMSRDIMNPLTPGDVRELVAYIASQTVGGHPFDVLIGGSTSGPGDVEAVRAYEGAGVTWWAEDASPWARSVDEVRARIAGGPPRL